AAYGNSRAAVIDTLAKYPSIKVVLDVHRDAIERDGKRIKPTCNVNGVAAAQLMIICGADDGTMNMPNYRKNLSFAAALQTAISAPNEGLCRPVLFDYRNYNQGLTTGSLLLEFGGHANTLDEAKYTAKLVAKAMVTLFTQK
ncbi:MAG: stage II sporulation protein P, partial [Oscillospiraceae bacterium]